MTTRAEDIEKVIMQAGFTAPEDLSSKLREKWLPMVQRLEAERERARVVEKIANYVLSSGSLVGLSGPSLVGLATDIRKGRWDR